MSNVSNDLIWELTKGNSKYLVKFQGTVFSKDPLNVTHKNSKNSSGLANDKAVGVTEVDGKVVVSTKVAKNANKPSKAVHVQKFNEYKAARKLALAVSNTTKGYRDDLRVVAVKTASQYSRGKTARKSYPVKSRK
ncbi:hypothetical protein DASC09_021570 [Saccharomycopsis crataegensis]|uniref:Ribosomal eL28/Mak16 domain-containing protein n=1 Tax=Saccharomycopsis crataegensis TaxID=43959 RepID=A0AAV5QJP6_9ASCO|nr:hypothetical protein DASC09_021570 [Saccharomycopsis crataegensis]